jgi:peptidoglycan hydrolase-like protein with peptidoglycan-binding domain
VIEIETLKDGSRGGGVVSLQALLSAKLGANLACDGCWSPSVEDAVNRFQEANSLPVTGEVDVTTWQTLLSC